MAARNCCKRALAGRCGPARRPFITDNEMFWVEVIRQASGDLDPAPNLDKVRRVRRVFRNLSDHAGPHQVDVS